MQREPSTAPWKDRVLLVLCFRAVGHIGKNVRTAQASSIHIGGLEYVPYREEEPVAPQIGWLRATEVYSCKISRQQSEISEPAD